MATAGQTASLVPAGFERQTVRVNGVDVVLFSGGSGDPLLFLHGAGTTSGFNFAARWAGQFRVYLPYHPGFGESGDGPAIASIDDYVLHYLELMDRLKLGGVRLIGHSLGGWIAAALAVRNSERLRKLVLVAPAGLKVPDHPTTDIFRLRPEEVPHYLVHDFNVLAPYLPDPHGPAFFDFVVNNYREMSSFARIAWERPYDPDLSKWLHRISVPTLLVYGERDRITPMPQSKVWASLIPHAKVETFADAGHLVLDESADAAGTVLEFLTKKEA